MTEPEENKEIKKSDADIAEILDYLVEKVADGTVDRLKEDYGNDENVFQNIQFFATAIWVYGEARKEGWDLHNSLVQMVAKMIHHPYMQQLMEMAVSNNMANINFGGRNYE